MKATKQQSASARKVRQPVRAKRRHAQRARAQYRLQRWLTRLIYLGLACGAIGVMGIALFLSHYNGHTDGIAADSQPSPTPTTSPTGFAGLVRFSDTQDGTSFAVQTDMTDPDAGLFTFETPTGVQYHGGQATDLSQNSDGTLSVQYTGLVDLLYTLGPPVTDVSLSPTSLDFGQVQHGTTSAAQTSTLTNTGAAALTIGSIAITGANASAFAQTNTCPSTLAIGASCTITVTFAPATTGNQSARLNIEDNADASPQSIALSGTGTGAIYFSDGFESGDLSQWTLPNSDSTGQVVVQSAVVNSGNDAAAITDSSGQYGYIWTTLPGGPESQTFTRFYFQLSALDTGAIVALARNANNQNIWEVDYNAYTQGLDIYFWDSTGGTHQITTGNDALSANTWYYLEVQATEATDGVGQVWLDGTSLGSISADLSTATPYARLMLISDVVGTTYFDDVQVSDSYNGPIQPTPASSSTSVVVQLTATIDLTTQQATANITDETNQQQFTMVTQVPGGELQVVQTYNQAILNQDWATVYTLTSQIVTSAYTEAQFDQLMTQQVQTVGTITAISITSEPQVTVDPNTGATTFTVTEQVTLTQSGASQTQSMTVQFILEDGTWKYLSSQ